MLFVLCCCLICLLCILCVVLYMCICFVFFFKQKTAYEMRISDWSSDVCSSDLPWSWEQEIFNQVADARVMNADGKTLEPLVTITEDDLREFEEIGRASCRERVCQYV